MSASKMRDMAKNDDYSNFKTGVPNLSATDSKALFNAVKKGMGIAERYESFTNFLNNDLREEYHQEKIFNIGDMVEHMDGSKGMIVRRGSNYVSYDCDGLIKKAWLYDIQTLDEAPRIPRKKGQPAGSDKHSDLYTDENPKGTIKGLKFATVQDAKDSVNKIKNSGKTHAHKIQAAVAMEQRAREMGKTAEAAVYRTYINKMKRKTKEMQKEDSIIDELVKEFQLPGGKFTDYIKSKTVDRKAVSIGMQMFKNKLKSVNVFKDKYGLAADIARQVGVGYREFQDVLTRAGLLEYYELGTDQSARHTMSMTPGQPIQNFRQYTMKIDEKDIDKYAVEGDTIDKYKKRYGENWKEELDKALLKMRNQLK